VTFEERATVCAFVETQARLLVIVHRTFRDPSFAAALRVKALD
jgi:hypothetical protein